MSLIFINKQLEQFIYNDILEVCGHLKYSFYTKADGYSINVINYSKNTIDDIQFTYGHPTETFRDMEIVNYIIWSL